MTSVLRRTSAFAALLFLATLASACATASGRQAAPPGTAQPDQFLYERGNAALERRKWLTAREYFKQVTETYTQSPVRPDAKLGIGDTAAEAQPATAPDTGATAAEPGSEPGTA